MVSGLQRGSRVEFRTPDIPGTSRFPGSVHSIALWSPNSGFGSPNQIDGNRYRRYALLIRPQLSSSTGKPNFAYRLHIVNNL